ncbi:hypothetical protein Tco_1234007 [Tanacetum coccineum]
MKNQETPKVNRKNWNEMMERELGKVTLSSRKSYGWDQFGSNIVTALICLSTGRIYNFSKLIFDGMIFGNIKRGFRGVPRPLLHAMLTVVVVDQSAGQVDQAVDQPSSSAPLPSSSHPPVLYATIESKPTPVTDPPPHPTSPSPDPDSEPIEHTFEQPSPEH